MTDREKVKAGRMGRGKRLCCGKAPLLMGAVMRDAWSLITLFLLSSTAVLWEMTALSYTVCIQHMWQGAGVSVSF